MQGKRAAIRRHQRSPPGPDAQSSPESSQRHAKYSPALKNDCSYSSCKAPVDAERPKAVVPPLLACICSFCALILVIHPNEYGCWLR